MHLFKNSSIRDALIATLVCLAAFFANNDVLTPDIMESRNIITAREMVYDGHWLVPTMNGDLRLEKPPLPTWLTAVAEAISPDSLALQRAMAGCAALLMVFFFWRIASRILKINAFVATLLLCTCYNIILMGRTATWDIYCHAFMLGGIYFMARGLFRSGPSLGYFAAAGIMTGLSIMSKGPVSLYALFLPFLIAFSVIYRPKLHGKGTGIALMAVLALAIGLWWYAYVHITQAEAWAAVVSKESGSWINHNVRPWWYYWQFFLEAGVWSLLLLTSIFMPLFIRSRRNYRPWRMAMWWMLASLVLLSLLPEKKPRYLLPLLIPAAYVMACQLQWWRQAFLSGRKPKADAIAFRINAWVLAAATVALSPAAWVALVQGEFVSTPVWCAASAVSLALTAMLAASAVKLRPMLMLGTVTVLFALAEIFAMPWLGKVVNNPDMHSIALTQDDARLRGVPFYHLADKELRIELVYAAHRKIKPVEADSIASHLPMAILTRGSVGDELPAGLWQVADSTYIGRFDDNCRPKSHRQYRPIFIYNVTLLTQKNR